MVSTISSNSDLTACGSGLPAHEDAKLTVASTISSTVDLTACCSGPPELAALVVVLVLAQLEDLSFRGVGGGGGRSVLDFFFCSALGELGEV